MKLAVSSSAVDGLLASGALTHLEWLEACATVLDAEGVVFALRHLPRRDVEYLAQLRKNAIDTGLDVVALDAGTLFFGDDDATLRDEIAALARALGAPIVLFRLGAPGMVPPADIRSATDALKTATSRAKRENVTLALLAVPGTLAATLGDAKRLVKDVDSAWLRFVDEPLAMDAHPAERKTVLFYDVMPHDARMHRAIILRAACPTHRSWLAIDAVGGEATIAELAAWIRALRGED
jgi:sugar phosphate isomerase/epimerase